MKPAEIRKMSSEERLRKLEELRMELVKLRLQAKIGLLKDTAKIRNIKRDIARILTVMSEERLKGSGSKE
ncbi:MAG: 50S ribosomal protein L29 [Desulfurococcaceae archaeon]|nr:50S ribosomal protein L29 [Desulfurococcaceae archaeon]